jgi:ESF2/ABP1 family protein
MTSKKRYDFLDIESSDEDALDRGYDSDAVSKSKGRTAKRRKLTTSDENHQLSGSEDEISEDEVGDLNDSTTRRHGKKSWDDDGSKQEEEAPEENCEEPSKVQAHSNDALDLRNPPQLSLLRKLPKRNKTGVIYLSSLPPHLKPMALKNLLVQRGFGPITRVFLTPDVRSNSAPRRNNRRKMYTDGWVEFASKKTAKVCASTLNATIVGGKKSGWYHDDVWNMKYLTSFKWDDLMEQVQRERSEREARRRIEDTRSRKEDKIFLAGVEQGKAMEGMRKKREEKKQRQQNVQEPDAQGSSSWPIRRVFKQNEVKTKHVQDSNTLGEETKRVLGKIF